MINDIIEFLKPIFEELDLSNYLRVSVSDKADFQINSVFMISKDKNINPKLIGETIVNKINSNEYVNDYFNKVEFVLPGFINLFVSDKLINRNINKYITNGFIEKTNSEDVYFLDYGGPNVAKPLHIGHLRPAIIGESLKRILNLKGYKTISDVHLGDFGLQIGEVIYGIQKENISIDDIDINILNRIYPQMSALVKVDEEVYNECKRITFEVQKGNIEYQKYYDKIKEVSVNDIKRLYKYLDIDFDLWLGEIDTKPYIPKLMEALENKNLITESQGAKVVIVKEDTDKKEMPPVIVEKNDGSAIYATTDLAAIYERVMKYNPKYILYVVDARQSLHFEGVFRVCKLLGYNNNFEHIPFGTINGSDGKPFKTRNGEALKLDELINETKRIFLSKREENKNMSEEDLDKIVNAIIKYADLQNNREKNYNFDISKFSDVNGKTGPYILYTALRIRKILNSFDYVSKEVSDIIYNDIDKSLRMKLLSFNKYLDKSIEQRLPSVIAEYIYDLCNILNSFYQNVNISKIEEEDKKNDYLNVLELSFNILKECLNLLMIELPSEM